MRCIFCKRPTTAAEPEAHIGGRGFFGEAPSNVKYSDGTSSVMERFVLKRGDECGQCNHSLKTQEEAVHKQLGIFRVMFNATGTRSGRPVKFEQPGFYISRDGGDVFAVFNAERRPVTAPDGAIVHPARSGRPNMIQLDSFERDGDVANIRFTQTFNLNKAFVRGAAQDRLRVALSAARGWARPRT